MCGSDTSQLTMDELRRVAQLSKEAAAAHTWVGVAQGGVAGLGGFDLVFNVTTALPTGASEALLAVEQYIESQFSNPVTVVVNIGFASLPQGVLGQTSSSFTIATWPNALAGLQAGMDPDDTIQSYLPAGSTIPVRYIGNLSSVTNEDRVFFTLANYRAAIGTVAGTAASMTFSSNFSWDYTPQNGISPGAYCFQSVIAHEVGHALGFTSGADYRVSDIEALDIYRFQRSDGIGEYNPDTLAEFTTTARMVDKDAPTTNDDVNSDLIAVEYQMSDGVPNQASHFTARNPGIYIMDPTFGSGETFYPDFFRSGDSDMFDAIGWDFPPIHTSCEQAFELQCNGQRSMDNSNVSNLPNPPYGCGSGADHDGTLWFRFTATAISASISTCGSAAQDSTFAVYSDACGSLVEIACSEDGACGAAGLSSLCVTGLTVGETYYVQLSARTPAARGIYTLEIGCSCSGACCLPPPAGCLISKEDECADESGYWAGPKTTCVGDANGDGRDDTCEVEQANFSQLPTVDAEDIASNMDWTDLGPNQVLVDDYTSDARPIRSVRWWGSVLDPTTPPDGWFISFHEPLTPMQPAEPALGLYFCAAQQVTVTPTPIPVCDPPHAVLEYEVYLADCCLLHADADSRSAVVPAQRMGFLEELCFDYEIGIQAVVGVRYDEDPPGGDCVPTLTANAATGDFWGWHSTANAHGTHAAYSTAVATAGVDWQYGPWNVVSPACSSANMAFELITTAPAGDADSILWDNGLPNGGDDLLSQFGGQVSDCMTVDDVNFPNGALIQDLRWFNEEQSAFTWSGRIRLEIYPDTGAAAPDGSAMWIGMWVPDEGGTVTRTALGAGQIYPRYRYEVTGLNLTLPPGIWWIGVATADSPGGTGRSYWTSSHSSSPPPLLFFGGESYVRGSCVGSSTFQPWSSFTGGRKSDMSFRITAPNFADCNCNGVDDELDITTLTSTDCNTNGVPDECEPDCDGNGVPDDCDITQGSSVDCQANGVLDECDLFFGDSVDADHNTIPDECCEPVNPPQAGPAANLKNRFISFQGSNPGKLTALRVRLTSLQHPDPPNLPGREPTDFSAHENQVRWVGAPVEYLERTSPQPTFLAAKLQCTPYYRDWSTVGLVHVYGAEIMPSSLYHLQAIEPECDVKGGETNYSTSLTLATARWGDVDPPFNPPSTQSQPDTIDIVGLVNKFKDLTGAPTKVYARLQPAILDPGNGVNALDILSAVDAFKGFPYAYTGIVACPP